MHFGIAAFSTFAEITTAVALFYAGLPSFRYRSEIQQYVRERVARGAARLVEVVPSARNTESWAVLYKIGRLSELDALAPDHEENPGEFFFAPYHSEYTVYYTLVI